MDFSRRAMLGAMGGLAVGGSLAAMTGNAIAAPAAPEMTGGKDGLFNQQYGLFGWKPHKIDDIATAMDVAYKGYWYKGLGCGYGAFYSIVGTMANKYGAPYNIRCNAVSPGPVLTREAMAKTPTLLGRAAEPIEIVNLITYLCSDQASFITGSNYAIDAGRACQHR